MQRKIAVLFLIISYCRIVFGMEIKDICKWKESYDGFENGKKNFLQIQATKSDVSIPLDLPKKPENISEKLRPITITHLCEMPKDLDKYIAGYLGFESDEQFKTRFIEQRNAKNPFIIDKMCKTVSFEKQEILNLNEAKKGLVEKVSSYFKAPVIKAPAYIYGAALSRDKKTVMCLEQAGDFLERKITRIHLYNLQNKVREVIDLKEPITPEGFFNERDSKDLKNIAGNNVPLLGFSGTFAIDDDGKTVALADNKGVYLISLKDKNNPKIEKIKSYSIGDPTNGMLAFRLKSDLKDNKDINRWVSLDKRNTDKWPASVVSGLAFKAFGTQLAVRYSAKNSQDEFISLNAEGEGTLEDYFRLHEVCKKITRDK